MLKLKNIRLEKNLTQEQIADKINVTRSSYSIWEIETDIIPIKHLVDLCNYYNISIDYIFNINKIKQYENNKLIIDLKVSGNRLKELRKEKGKNQTEFSKILGCSFGTISGYEIGRYPIATTFLYDICHKYNISADYLLGRIDNPKYLK